VGKEPSVDQLKSRLKVDASETQMGLALGVAAVGMGLMLWAIIWQSNIIAYQRDLLKWMWSAHFG
jgi:hypothetical protein